MVEIKFRGKSTNTGKFVYGYFCYNWDSVNNLLPMIQHSVLGTSFGYNTVELETVGQYTGLMDKQGKDIYDGDILKDEREHIFRIYKEVGGFVIKAWAWANNTKDFVPTDALITQALSDVQMYSYVKQSCEIIGNIYDNPELIK